MTKQLLPWELIDKILIFSDNKYAMLKMKRYYALSKIDQITNWAYDINDFNFIKYLASINLFPTKKYIDFLIKNNKDDTIEYILFNIKKTENNYYYFYTQYIVYQIIEYNKYDIIISMFYEGLYDYEFFNDSDFLIEAILENKFYIAGFLHEVVKIKIPEREECSNYSKHEVNMFLEYINIENTDNNFDIIEYLIENKMNIEIKHVIDYILNDSYYIITRLIDSENLEMIEILFSNNNIEIRNDYLNYAIFIQKIYCAKFLKDIYNLEYNKNDILLKFHDEITKAELDYNILLFEGFCKFNLTKQS